jgi:hypothetical protein
LVKINQHNLRLMTIAYLIMTLDKIDKSNKSFNNTKSIAVIIQRVEFEPRLNASRRFFAPLCW